MPISADIYNAFAPKVVGPQDVTNGLMQQELRGQALQAGQMGLDERRQALANAPALAAQAAAEAKAKQEKLAAETKQAEAHAANYGADTELKKLHKARETTAYLAQKVSSLQTDDDIANWYKEGVQRGVISPDAAMAEIQKVPPAGPAREQWKQQQAQLGMTVTEQMTRALAVRQQAETAQHNRTVEAQTAAHNKATEGIAGAHLGLARAADARAATAPKGQIVQTDQGPMLVDPRDPSSAKPITTSDGTALGPKLKDAPAAVQKAMIENGTNLRRAERALALVQGKNVGGARGDTEATGLKGFLPNQILNRVDPVGVETRAAVADLGSLVIHDRSGAAVSASEFPRLAPFIPSEKDDAATVKKKLEHFVRVYKDEMSATEQAYGPDSGYRQLAGQKVAPAAGAYSDPDKERRYQEWKKAQGK